MDLWTDSPLQRASGVISFISIVLLSTGSAKAFTTRPIWIFISKPMAVLSLIFNTVACVCAARYLLQQFYADNTFYSLWMLHASWQCGNVTLLWLSMERSKDWNYMAPTTFRFLRKIRCLLFLWIPAGILDAVYSNHSNQHYLIISSGMVYILLYSYCGHIFSRTMRFEKQLTALSVPLSFDEICRHSICKMMRRIDNASRRISIFSEITWISGNSQISDRSKTIRKHKILDIVIICSLGGVVIIAIICCLGFMSFDSLILAVSMDSLMMEICVILQFPLYICERKRRSKENCFRICCKEKIVSMNSNGDSAPFRMGSATPIARLEYAVSGFLNEFWKKEMSGIRPVSRPVMLLISDYCHPCPAVMPSKCPRLTYDTFSVSEGGIRFSSTFGA